MITAQRRTKTKTKKCWPWGGILVVLAAMLVMTACSSTPPEPDEPDVAEQPEAPAEEPEETPERAPRPDPRSDAEAYAELEAAEIEAAETDDEMGEQVASHVAARVESAVEAADDGDYEEAIDALNDLIDEPEGGFLAAYNLGVIRDRRGELGAALSLYVEALQRQPDFTPALTNLIRLYIRAGELSEADAVARQFIEIRPDNLDHRASHLEVWLAQGRYEDVVQGARDLLRQDVAHVEAMLRMATAKYRLRRYELAEAILERALQLSPDRADIYYLLGQVSWAQQNEDAARANFRQAIELQPRFPEARNNYALLLYEAGNYQRAINHLETSLDDSPNDAQVHVNLGNALKALGEYTEAERSYQRALMVDDGLGAAHFNLGILYLEADVAGYETIERYELAIESFQGYRDAVGQREASESPVATYINQALAAIEDEEERLEALRRAQMEHDGDSSDDEEDSEE